MFASMRNDIRVIKQRDPAVKNTLEIVLCYSGLHAIWAYRLSHFFYKKSWFVTARFISTLARLATGIEIHPGAQIGEGCSSTMGPASSSEKPPSSATMFLCTRG